MATTSITATADWQQITDGTVDKVIQSIGGEIRLCDSPTKPDGKMASHRVNGWATISAPTVAWIRAAHSDPVMVIIS